MGVSVDLELGPVASVTEEMRKAVAAAFRDAGLDFNWTTPPGGWGNGSAASPTLRIFLQSDASSSSLGVVDAIRPQLTAALTGIRAGLPALPLGFLTVTSSAKRLYSFRPTDTRCRDRSGDGNDRQDERARLGNDRMVVG